jgi:RHS repeat-associated protein
VQSTANGTATNGVIRSYTVGSNSNRLLDYSQITVGPSGSVTTSASYSYNANGDLVNDGKRYNYNAEGRMTSLTTGLMASSKTTRYAYNALGQRVFKTEPLLNGGTTTELASPTFVAAPQAFYAQQWNPAITAEQAGWEYLYDEDGNLAAEYGTGGPDSAGAAKYMYLPTPNGPMPIVAFIDARRYAVHTDHLNTPRRLTLPSGTASWQWKYSAFGDEQPTLALNRFVNTSVNPNPGTTTTPAVTYNARYPGQYADKESGLNYNYFRTYNAETGRYTQSDPIGLGGGWNRFGYVGGNALQFTDPRGLGPVGEAVGGAIGAWGGRAGGAVVGTFIEPGGGTIAGAVGGGILGRNFGKAVGNIVGDFCAVEKMDYCATLQAKIKVVAQEIRDRYFKALNDPRDLFNKANIEKISNRGGSWIGHQQQIRNKQVELRNLIAEADLVPCPVDPFDRLLATMIVPPERPAAR